ncbi:ATP-binding cassette domain-containing protein [bacterium]|nr:ATP-binding cassette domain-containing protein [bacterium]
MIRLDLDLRLAHFPLRVDLDLPSRSTAVMGPSGAGKTSLLETIAGLRPGARGRIEVDGQVLLDTAAGVALPPERRGVGWVPQDAGLFPHLSALDNVRFGAGRARGRVDAAIDALGLEPLLDRPPARLSGGERRRIALARALATSPRLLLLDEPLSGLDAALRDRVLPWLKRIRDEWDVTILHVTHHLGEALALDDELVLLHEGRVEGRGTPIELAVRPGAARSSTTGLENLRRVRVAAHDAAGGITLVDVPGEPALAIPLVAELPVGAEATIAVRAEDLLVVVGEARGLSARNQLPARVVRVVRGEGEALLECATPAGPVPWFVRLTPQAVAALGLVPGAEVRLAAKSHSIRVVG